MEKSKVKQTIEELKEQYQYIQQQFELKVLDKCPFIVEVGALTISTDETGRIITQNTNQPTQFSQKAVDEIMAMIFRNGNGEKIKPVVYGRNDWYGSRLKIVEESLELFGSTIM